MQVDRRWHSGAGGKSLLHRGGGADSARGYHGAMDIDYAILADHAEVVGNKLYLMGGGWDTVGANDVPAPLRLAIAAGIRIEWDETNVPIPVVITIDDDDAQEVLRLQAEVNMGRPPGLPAGASQLSQVAVTVQVSLPRFGGYRVNVVAGAGDGEVRRGLPFRLVRRGQPQPPRAE